MEIIQLHKAAAELRRSPEPDHDFSYREVYESAPISIRGGVMIGVAAP